MKKIRLKTLLGFTLIELMITVAIIAILVIIAYPSYLERVRKTRRVDAKIALVELAQLQEDSFITKKKYLTDNSAIMVYGGRGYNLDNYGNGNYKLAVNGVDGFTLRATPIGNQTKDTDCSWFEINAIGQKTAEHDDCW